MDRLSRRLFVQGGALALAAFGSPLLPGFARRALAEPAGPGRRRTLVFLFLTGGLDGLSVLQPYGEQGFAELRPNLAHPPPGAAEKKGQPSGVPLLPLESGLGLHPALEPLLQLYREKSLAFVHAVGQPSPTRSHFDAQDFLELGTPGEKNTPDGWLSRALQLAPLQQANPLQDRKSVV